MLRVLIITNDDKDTPFNDNCKLLDIHAAGANDLIERKETLIFFSSRGLVQRRASFNNQTLAKCFRQIGFNLPHEAAPRPLNNLPVLLAVVLPERQNVKLSSKLYIN